MATKTDRKGPVLVEIETEQWETTFTCDFDGTVATAEGLYKAPIGWFQVEWRNPGYRSRQACSIACLEEIVSGLNVEELLGVPS